MQASISYAKYAIACTNIPTLPMTGIVTLAPSEMSALAETESCLG